MKAIRIHDYGDASVLKYEDAPAEALIVGTCRKISKLRCLKFNDLLRQAPLQATSAW